MLIEEIKKRGKMHIVRLGDIKNFFRNTQRYNKNKEIYRVIAIEREQLSYAITIIKPGKINGEFFMTKGHYHKIPASEVYYLIKGRGIIIMQRGNKFRKINMRAGEFYEILEGYAHRTINTGRVPLEFLSIYPTNAGHDYKTIEKEGFKKRFFR